MGLLDWLFGKADKVNIDKPHGKYPEHYDLIWKIGDSVFKERIDRKTGKSLSVEFLEKKRKR